MASIGHVAVGMAAARIHRKHQAPSWRSMLWWSALSLLPDADVIGFAMGVRYADPWGHRGATHSFAFAFAVAAGVGLAARSMRLPVRRTWWIATVVLVSHALLDTITDGGLGCALLWPFDLTRYFAPRRPIRVAPIGLAFLSPYGLFVAMTELILFAPLVVFALRPARIGWSPRQSHRNDAAGDDRTA
jgi:inner membrane protein